MLPASERLLSHISGFLLSIADVARLRILLALRDGERCVTEIAQETGCRRAEVSKTLTQLRRAGLVALRRDGEHLYYRAIGPEVFAICATVCASLGKPLPTETDVTAS